jgi:hypothetical protein
MRVSVVICANGRGDSLAATVRSLRALDHLDVEVIVVAGPDRETLGPVLPTLGADVQIVDCPARNLSVARNLGIRAAAGQLVAFIDDDAVADPGWLTPVVAAFRDEDVVAAGGPVFDHTGGSFQARYSVCSRTGAARALMDGANPSNVLCAPGSWVVPYTIGTNACYRRDRLLEVGGFDEQYDYYLDEADVCLRLVDRGWVVRLLDNGFVYHGFLASHLRTEARVISDWSSILRNTAYFAWRHASHLVSPARVIDEVATLVAGHRAGVEWWTGAGLVDEGALSRFDDQARREVPGGLVDAQGPPRTRPASWFGTGDTWRPLSVTRPPEPRMHLCFLTEEYLPARLNGIARVIHVAATELAQRGHVVRVLTAGTDRLHVERSRDGVWVHRVPLADHQVPPDEYREAAHRWAYSAAIAHELQRIDQMRPITVVQAPNWNSEAIAVIAERAYPVSLGLYTSLQSLIRTDPRFSATDPVLDTMLRMERDCYERADRLLACGDAIVREIETGFEIEVDRSRVTYIPHGLPDRAGAGEEGGPAASHDAVEVLFVGRLEPRKGIDVLLGATAEVLSEYPEIVITIAGDDTQPGPDGRTYRAAFESEYAGDRIRFLGSVDDAFLDRLYARCDLVVVPSRFESFGLILVEAMMFGKPVIASDIGGMGEIVDHGETGLLVPADDPSALADAILRLARSPEIRRRMGAEGRRRYERSYTAARMASALVEHFSSLTRAPSPA